MTLLVLVGAAVLMQAGPAWCCSCARGTPTQHAARADVVLTGTVTSLVGGRSATIVVATVHKGVPAARLTVTTFRDTCGFAFHEGRTYTLFASWTRTGALSMNLCSGNVEGAIDPQNYGLTAREPAARTAMPEPAPAEEDPSWTWAAGAGGVLLIIGAFLLTRRHPPPVEPR